MWSLRYRRRFVSLAVAGAGYAVLAGDAMAVDRNWTNGSGGTFTVASNWSGGIVPSAADRAVFDLSDSGYTVDFVSNVLTNQLLIRDDVVTFDLANITGSFTYSLNDSIILSTSIVGESANLRINSGTVQTSAHLGVTPGNVLTLGSGGKLNTGSASINGRVALAGTQAAWVNTGAISVGSAALAAELVADFGGSITTTTLVVGSTNNVGYVHLDDQSQLNAGTVFIASGGAGSMELLRGADAVLTGRLSVGHFPSGGIPSTPTRGSVFVADLGSRLAAAELLIGGELGEGTLDVRRGASVSTTGLASIGFNGGAGTVVLDGTGSRWDAASISVGSGGFGMLDVRAGTSVVATGTLTVGTFGTVNVTDATLSVGTFGPVIGRLNFNSGTLAVTGASGLSIGGASAPLGTSIQLNGDQDLKATATLTLQSGGQLALDGGRVIAGTLTNNGELVFLSPTSRVTGQVNNFGIIRGSGAIVGGGVTRNRPGGQISVGSGERLRVVGGVVNEAGGMIDIADGGELDGGNLSNNGRIFIDDGLLRASSIDAGTASLIQGRGSVITAGLFVNNGTVSLSGGFTDVVSASNYENRATGKTIVSGGATASFFLPVNNVAGSEFRVSTNSTAVFFNAVSGLGAFTGTGTVVFEGPASVGVIDRGGTTVVEPSGALAVGHVRDDALVARGPVTVTPDGTAAGTSRVNRLEIDGGRLDLTNNDLVIDYAGPTPIADVRQQIRSAFNNGSWNGDGLATSHGTATGFGLGYTEAGAIFTTFPATFSGQAVDDTSVLVMFTRFGDANLSGTVNLQDFNRLAANFGATSALWSQGDFNYDGLVNLQDFNRLAANFGLTAAGPDVTPQDWAALAAAVPEPGAGLAGLCGGILLRRRRR